jgi:hypothetical protein
MATTITVQVTADAADDGAAALDHLARELGVAIRPLHPGTDDSALRTYFTVEVPNAASAERVAARLRDSPAVAAAYVKPPDAMP